MPKANFFIIGASKCGTTSFYNILNQHPDICLSSIKETEYFALPEKKKSQIDYKDYFKHCTGEKIIGEVCPSYSELNVVPWVPENIYNYNSNAKIIYLIRNPIDRIESVWKQTLYSGHWQERKYYKRFGLDIPKMSLNFEKSIFEYPPFIESCKYWKQINGYRKYFSDEQIKIILFEDYVNKPEQVFESIFNFLDIKNVEIKNLNKKYNSSSQKKMINPKINKYLPTSIINLLRSVKMPKTIKQFLKNIVTDDIPEVDSEITPELKQKILNELNTDIKKILDYANKEPDYWNL